MSIVNCNQFVSALRQIGISFPKNCTKATIRLSANDLVRIECELVVKSFSDETGLCDSTVTMGLSQEKVTKLFRLIEDEGDAGAAG